MTTTFRTRRGVALRLMILATFAAMLASCATDAPPAPEPVRVLLVTGEDYKGHIWQETAPAVESILAADPRFEVETVEDLTVLRDPSIHEHDVVVMHFKNYDPEVPGRAGFDNLTAFVEAGGGLVLLHFAGGAFQEFDADFVKLAGRTWNPELRGHDPRGPFTVEVAVPDHPITAGLDAFETEDELYTCLDGDIGIEVLAHARSRIDGEWYPMAFVLDYGAGRVFHTPLGHDVKAFRTPGTAELIRRGTAWAAGLSSASHPAAAALEPGA